jgi:hypothetical protein
MESGQILDDRRRLAAADTPHVAAWPQVSKVLEHEHRAPALEIGCCVIAAGRAKRQRVRELEVVAMFGPARP